MNILIVKLSAIGDVVQSLPFLEAIREGLPEANIDWLVEEAASQIIEGHPAVRRVIVSRRKSWQERLWGGRNIFPVIGEVVRLLKEVRADKYDLIIDLQGLLKSGVLTALSKGKRKIGMSGSREGAGLFLNERPVVVDYDRHAIDRYLKVAEYLGCDSDGWMGHIPVFESDRGGIDRILNNDGVKKRPLVAINPLAKWTTKLWDHERFAILADRIRDELACEVVFTGSPVDGPVIGRITGIMKGATLNLAGRTSLKELAYLYSRCRLLVTVDTGPMHMAAAMGCPVVALFGPTAPWRTGPYGKGHQVIRADIECSPCFKKRCDHMSCMKEITVDGVFEGVKKVLEGQTPEVSGGIERR
ncbi:MAG: lipopolysaccharide heptosyltransferase II [Proteobacteria bacterium]|nr:lipopolysaccharide heptosyltransferase II [Desulfobacterales bacterium]MBU1902561.1 lipopolysaccharide heptosyltransferase II [Pseudomonadota bacterium]